MNFQFVHGFVAVMWWCPWSRQPDLNTRDVFLCRSVLCQHATWAGTQASSCVAVAILALDYVTLEVGRIDGFFACFYSKQVASVGVVYRTWNLEQIGLLISRIFGCNIRVGIPHELWPLRDCHCISTTMLVGSLRLVVLCWMHSNVSVLHVFESRSRISEGFNAGYQLEAKCKNWYNYHRTLLEVHSG